MVRPFLLVAALVSSTAVAAGVGPSIAYSVGRDVYLINQDGSGKRLVYRGAVGTSIFSLSLKKDGGELSFEEVAKNGQSARLKTISYGTSGAGQVTRDIAGCRWDVSTRDDGALLVVDWCDHKVKFAAAGSSALTTVVTPGSAGKAVWMADGSFVYTSNDTIRVGTIANPTGSQVTVQNCVQNLAAAHSAMEVMVSVGPICAGPTMFRLSVPSGTRTQIAAGSPDAAYSQDDACFILISEVRRGGYLLIARVDESVASSQLGNSAAYKGVDWRADTSPQTCRLVSANALQFRTVK